MKPWSAFADFILPEVISCPWPYAQQVLKDRAEMFFRDYGLWHIRSFALLIQAGVTEYPVNDMPHTMIERCTGATLDGRDLKAVPRDHFDALIRRQWTPAPPEFVSASSSAVRVFPAPLADGNELKCDLLVYPTIDCPGLPDELFHRYRQVITKGTIADLLLKAKKPYSDPATGALRMKEYEAEAGALAFADQIGHTEAIVRGDPTWY